MLSLMRARGGIVTADDLREYEADLERAARGRLRRHARPDPRRAVEAAGPAAAAAARCAGSSETERVLERPARCSRRAAPETHTTNVSVVDADGNACAFTTSLGLGCGDFLPGLDLHLNSMLGEVDLVVGDLVPGERMGSMMAPSLVLDEDGLVLAAGAAGGTRLPTALALVLAGILDEGLEPQAAVDRPRFHPTGDDRQRRGRRRRGGAGVSSSASGRTVRRWPGLHHYFGGVSTVGRTGAAADPRRSGAGRSSA